MTIFKTSMLAACSLVAVTAAAQESNPSIAPIASLRYEQGMVAHTNDFLRGENMAHTELNSFSTYTATLGLQTTGKQEWEHVLNFPQYGIGFSLTRLDHSAEIGKPFSVFAFYNGTFMRSGRHTLRYAIDAGIGTHWKPYDFATNPYNITIGSRTTVHIGFGLEYGFRLSDQWEVGAGVGVTHFSNGATRKPNKGLNLMSPRLKMTYTMRKVELPERHIASERPKGNELFVVVGYGQKRDECFYYNADTLTTPGYNPYPANAKFCSATLQMGYLRQYGFMGKWGGGLNLLYDTWMGSTITPRYEEAVVDYGQQSKRYAVGLFGMHELCLSRLSVITQLGVTVWEPSGLPEHKTRDFERMGVRYTLSNNISAGVNIFAHQLSKADFIEWNVGYRLPL